MTQLKTRAEARKEFERTGQSITAFAREHGIHPNTFFEVLGGRKKGKRGDAHRAAVLLGLKEGVIKK